MFDGNYVARLTPVGLRHEYGLVTSVIEACAVNAEDNPYSAGRLQKAETRLKEIQDEAKSRNVNLW